MRIHSRTQFKKNQVLRPNSDQFAKIERLKTQLQLWKVDLVQLEA
jgi:hypothetical protein